MQDVLWSDVVLQVKKIVAGPVFGSVRARRLLFEKRRAYCRRETGDCWLAIPSVPRLPRRYCCSIRPVDGKRPTQGAPYPGFHERRRNCRFAGDGSAGLRLRSGRPLATFTRPTSDTSPGISRWSGGMLPSLPAAPYAEKEQRYEFNARWPSRAGIAGIVVFFRDRDEFLIELRVDCWTDLDRRSVNHNVPLDSILAPLPGCQDKSRLS